MNEEVENLVGPNPEQYTDPQTAEDAQGRGD